MNNVHGGVVVGMCQYTHSGTYIQQKHALAVYLLGTNCHWCCASRTYVCMHVCNIYHRVHVYGILCILFIRTPFRASNFIDSQWSTNIIYYTVFSPGEIFGLPPTLMCEN